MILLSKTKELHYEKASTRDMMSRKHVIHAILPAHSSHLTQPLDIGVFEESKVLASKIAPFIHTQVLEFRKIEWLHVRYRPMTAMYSCR